ncbi:hypothetical protein COV24_03340 [candidate division WWE3 bacterium CG10_big_fil_rev_8_21_14_0_10_32_10]|uniref:DNA ligase n=1 Tax=candidate division WWE3 bacterium CG10_big_fil_rev_8_21_14_0_10_32_10 TaxID=1975090 RepID=A0A2H0R9X0_UNCKA|nr:MAG: hypothetical protein COV24_03340 [candidate division WWE3 bacterium CG10_big_fil_rev_8_21_14_0_10_32_10]
MDYKKAKIDQLFDLSIENIQKLAKEDKIIVLERLVKYHNKLYFIENNPIISDAFFDELTETLKSLKPNSTVLFEIVGTIGDVEHPVPMLSIDKKYNYDDIKKWVVDVDDTNFLVEPKYDGMRARYNNGLLATRGNGIIGENISERFKHLNVIGTIPKSRQVQGEIVIPQTYFNETLSKDYKNSRNAVVGIIKAKQITPSGIKALQEGGVHFVLYDQVFAQKVKKDDLLSKDLWESILEQTFQSDYPLDGVVIKATNTHVKSSLGATAHHNRWEVAYKVPAEKKWSKVKKITDQVGRIGRITSVANIEPIQLSGATVTNVTLHNFDFVKKSKIGVGSKVEVMRSGEVIPFITNVKPAKKPHKVPNKCPVCNTKLVWAGKYLECPNKECTARLSQSIEYFFKTLNVEELGLKTIEKFMDIFDLKNVIDFYNLKREQISVLDGFGKKSADNIINNIQNTLDKSITPEQLLQALGIKEIGPSTSRWIINEHGFDNLKNLKKEDIENVKGIGPIKAEHFVNEVTDKWWIVNKLKVKGLKFKVEKKSNKLHGLSFCVTGKKEQYSRDELIEMIKINGGKYKSSVTKDLDYLIAGDDAGSKLEKAKQNNVKVISEKEFLQML